MSKTKSLLFLLCGIFLMMLTACHKNNFENSTTLRKLYNTYEDGEISRCQLNSAVVFTGALNAYDAGSAIYDEAGRQLGVCNYAWGQVDTICNQLTDCETVYRVKDNIWGAPAVDKYGLGK